MFVNARPRPPGWPAHLGPLATSVGPVRLRPLKWSDGQAWRSLRLRDEALIRPWEPSSPLSWGDRHTRQQWMLNRSVLRNAAKQGGAMPFAIDVADHFAGQVTIGGVVRGPLQSAWIGYWVDSTLAGKGVATSAVALALAYGFNEAGLHRIEATIAPENLASHAVVRHLGFRHEGLLHRYLDIDNAWHDHDLYALTSEELPGGLTDLIRRWDRRPR
ncbi:N-acetyltransferase [Nakamurella silvestris]|nr:N-acetyltransferase [Nakamurella silvestris]